MSPNSPRAGRGSAYLPSTWHTAMPRKRDQRCENRHHYNVDFIVFMGFPGGSDGKASAYNAGDLGSIPGSGRSPAEGNDCPLHYSGLENPMDRGAWWAAVHGVAKSRTQLSD